MRELRLLWAGRRVVVDLMVVIHEAIFLVNLSSGVVYLPIVGMTASLSRKCFTIFFGEWEIGFAYGMRMLRDICRHD